ncbi:hypothetical protein Pst134EA_022769 [Puccinia striiformis f. sp. tritici]|uniref:hypothetical protein n=1 Tax=Puccinia striiformis f. sp. tritici TaxID=168172 RepID=UPI002007E6D6|nr:hypothetical protein Pst134EA_022769 [Puccinia striiformis f. sp. tritici]KAH9455298.1 hypothetical protein Pst134EA_022769 [Puccinia striiformis f. sp. tritici]KAI9612253.1 hypothetical protein KEM48_004269 [Puccinia striiformis f. sp. tritici PST-130]
MPRRRQPQAPRSQQNQTIPTQSQQQSGRSNTTASQSIATQSEENLAEPQSNPQDEQSNTSKDTQKSPKRAPGSQGYNNNDSQALVRAIKEVLPLGANKWSRVVDMYSDYAQKNQRAFWDEKSIRNKFKFLHSARKPTGGPMIKDFIRDAKAAFEEMRARAASYENIDVDEDEDEEYESDDKRNNQATTRNPLVHRADSSRPVNHNTPISQTARQSRTSNSDGLCKTLQEANNTNTQLTDENRHLRDGINATIACLTEENHKLQHGVNTQILQLQDDKRHLQDEKPNLAIELQGLRSQLQLNQLCAEWQYGPQQFYHSQPNGMFQGAGMGGPGYMNMNPNQMANNSFPNDASYAPGRGSAAASRPGPLDD